RGEAERVGLRAQMLDDHVVRVVHREARLLLHRVLVLVEPERDLRDVESEVRERAHEHDGDEAAETGLPGARARDPHHCDCAPAMMSLTSFFTASARPSASLRSAYVPLLTSPLRDQMTLPDT